MPSIYVTLHPRSTVILNIGRRYPRIRRISTDSIRVNSLNPRKSAGYSNRSQTRSFANGYAMMRRMLHAGLTGNIASGKSTASKVFAELGAHIIDADVIAHDLLKPETGTHKKVVESFGSEIVHPDGTIDRKKLGEIV